MVAIGFALRLWADEHDGRWPSNLPSISNELSSPLMLHCPGDRSHPAAPNWAVFTPENSSYEMMTSGSRTGDSNQVILRCRVHGHLLYADDTVFDGVRRRRKIP